MTISNGVTNLTRGVYVAVFAAALLFSSNVGVAFAALDNPVVTPDTFSIPENSVNGTVVGTVVASDPELPLTYAITAGNTGGAFAINSATGEITVDATAALDFEVTPSFALTVTATDSEPLAGSATITINLSDVNEAPTADDDTYSVSANGTLTVLVGNGVLVGDADADLDPLTAVDQDAGVSAHGTYTLSSDGSFVYTPTPGYAGPDSFTYVANDGGLDSVVATVNITVTQLSQSISFTAPADITYGDSESVDLTASSDAGGSYPVSFVVSGAGCSMSDPDTVAFHDATTCTITASQAGDPLYAPAVDVTDSFDVLARAITVTAQAETKVYDGTTDGFGLPAITAGTLAFSDSEDFLQTYDFADVGTFLTLTPSGVVDDGNGGANYIVTPIAANVGTITKAPLTITADNKTKVYGNANPVATATYSGFVAGENASDLTTDVTLVVVANNQTDVNNHPITAFGATSDNYLITHENGNLEITKRPITVTVTAASKTYDGDTDTTATLAPVGVLFSDVVTASHTGATFDTENVGTGKTVTTAGVSLGGADANNYSVAVSATGTADITALPIAITADAKTKAYGAADPALTYQVTSGALVSGDSFTGALDRAAGENVGAYAIGQGTLTPGTNYAVSYIPANLTVTQATLNATADDQTKVYGAAVPTLSITYSGFQLGDDAGDLDSAPTAATVATDSSDVGTYAITVSGGGDANYTFTYTDGELSVTPLAITVDVAADNKIYDNNTDAVVLLTPNAAILGDTITAGYTSASFVDENVDTGITVNVSGITLGGVDADNYSVAATATGSADITVRPLNVQATSNTKVYGAADPVFAYTSDILSGDTFTGALSRAAGEDVGTYAMTVGTLDAGSNYDTIAFTSANMHITPATLTVTADDKTKTYGTANPALTITYGTFQNGDDENDLDTEPTASTLADTNSNVGDWTISPAGGVSDNYTFNYVNGTLTITKADQTITFGALSDVNFGVADFTVSASSDSLLSVAFAASGACTITGNTVHLTTKGTCTITASQVGDTNWNAASDVVRTFEVLDVTAPVITLNGNATETITSGSVYADAGASASDDVDGDVSGSIVVVNPVNTDTIGTYTITYNVTDSSSNVATEVTRTVEVVARRSGGGGFSRPDTTPVPAGRVLGASSYNFQANLTIGSAGNDVIELQKVLIAGGFLKIAAPTGFFGPMTAAAVKLYQASKGINATGFVGPLTRAALNAEGTPTKTVEEQIAELMAKLKLLQAQAGQ